MADEVLDAVILSEDEPAVDVPVIAGGGAVRVLWRAL